MSRLKWDKQSGNGYHIDNFKNKDDAIVSEKTEKINHNGKRLINSGYSKQELLEQVKIEIGKVRARMKKSKSPDELQILKVEYDFLIEELEIIKETI